MIKHLTTNDFDAVIKDSKLPVMVDFWATWCGPCQRIAPILEQLATEVDGKAVIAKVEVDEQPQLADRFGIMSIPTILIFKDGKIVDQLVGLRSKDDLKKHLGL